MPDDQILIDQNTCNACGLCVEVCPVKLYIKNGNGGIRFRQDRLPFCIQCGQCMAVCPTCSVTVEGLSYERNFFEFSDPVTGDAPFMEMIATRRAIRNYKDKPVPRDLLEQVVKAVAFAPPGFTPIKTELVVVQDPEVVSAALSHMIEVYDGLLKALRNPVARLVIRRKVGPAKFNTLQSHVAPLMENRLPELKRGEEDTITRHAPAMILFHAHKDAENHEADIYIALTYAFLAAHALGLGGSAIDLVPPAIQNSAELRKMLAIPESNVVVGATILGYPKYCYQRSIKRDLKRIVWI